MELDPMFTPLFAPFCFATTPEGNTRHFAAHSSSVFTSLLLMLSTVWHWAGRCTVDCFFVDNGCLLQQETMPTRLKQNSKGADREKKWNNELKTAKNCAESADIGLHLKWRWIQELRSISRRNVGHVLLIIPYQMTKEKKFHWIINIAPEEPRSCEGSLPSLLSRRLDRTCSSYTLSPSACRLVYALLSAVAAKVCLPSSLDSK